MDAMKPIPRIPPAEVSSADAVGIRADEACSCPSDLPAALAPTPSAVAAPSNRQGDNGLAAIRELPIRVVSSRSVKIGDEVYALDRPIKLKKMPAEPNPNAAGEVHYGVGAEGGVAPAEEWNTSKRPASAVAPTGGRPAKRKNLREYFLEIKWGNWEDGEDGEGKYVTYSMFADEIPKRGGGLEASRAIIECQEGENHQHCFSMCLVDGKSEGRRVLVEIEIYYWIVPINLMHFNILSQDLANFCRALWTAAGRREELYCDMAIEFGESKFSKVKISTLVNSAVGIKGKKHVAYVNSAKLNEGATVTESLKLLEMIFAIFPAFVIAYEVDLKSLGIHGNHAGAGFEKIRGISCFVGPNRKFSLV